jgi:hypothetical protein
VDGVERAAHHTEPPPGRALLLTHGFGNRAGRQRSRLSRVVIQSSNSSAARAPPPIA